MYDERHYDQWHLDKVRACVSSRANLIGDVEFGCLKGFLLPHIFHPF